MIFYLKYWKEPDGKGTGNFSLKASTNIKCELRASRPFPLNLVFCLSPMSLCEWQPHCSPLEH